MNQKSWWSQVASLDLETVKGHLWGAYSPDNEWCGEKLPSAHLQFLQENGVFNRVLDFGCGLGRNAPMLKSLYQEVYGFDTVPMIRRLHGQPEMRDPYTLITRDWNDLKDLHFDCIFECTVFQHLPVQQLKERLRDMSQMTSFIVGLVRCYNDETRSLDKGGENLMEIIEELDCFEIVDCSIPLEEARTKMDDTHYRILLKSSVRVPSSPQGLLDPTLFAIESPSL